ncbi:MAG TPA: hypothetical protein VK324_06925 [Tepidisphaeraceae bacterium]|nr:hypothetical protein [Tepidisphaeraceae bacterium]
MTTPAVPDYAAPAAHVPLRERVNFRLLGFLAMVAVLVGFPAYWYIDEVVSGGVKDRGDYLEVNLKAMSVFPFDQVNGTIDDVPAAWRALDGKKVMLSGEMWTGGSAADQVRAFQLCYSVAKCCFSGPPQVQHFVNSRARNGGWMPFHSGPVNVTGTLHVKVKHVEGKVASVYEMDVDKIEPAT